MTTLPRRRKLIYALAAIGIAMLGCVVLLLAADVYVHARTQEVAGVNVWGYRGRPIGKKQPGEIRVAMAGGSTVYGWGLPADESIPAFLERRLNQTGSARFTVINLGAPGQGAYGFVTDLVDFAFLDYDIICLYGGYNDLGPMTIRGRENYLLWRRESPVFRWTGYYPILPIVLREKADLMMGKNAGGDQVQFRAGTGRRVAADAMRAVAAMTGNLAGQVGGLSPVPPDAPVDPQCIDTWKNYCGSVREAIEWARGRNKPVIVVTEPFVSDAHREQQANLAAMITSRFGTDPRVTYVNLGDAIDMRDRNIAYDGLHLVATGNDTIAARLVDPILEAAR